MPRLSIASELRVPYALAAVAGVLLALAFPRVSVAGFAWIAPGLLLFAAAGFRPGLSFRIGYVGGFVYYLCTLNWLLYIPVKFFSDSWVGRAQRLLITLPGAVGVDLLETFSEGWKFASCTWEYP